MNGVLTVVQPSACLDRLSYAYYLLCYPLAGDLWDGEKGVMCRRNQTRYLSAESI